MRQAQHLALAALALSLTPTFAVAERNLVPTLDRSFDVCPDRPAEPVWMQEIPLRQAYQRVLVQDIYRAQNLERIVQTGSCDCEIRFPSWDAAEAVFRESYASDERWEMLEASDGYNRRANAARTAAKAICDAAGNW
ncbi:conserved hypothetical protein (plasmid) [Dinoroseobacter shibae DFL 12 = DSM 16493]|jgi:hypothetical protein|uniref:Uncharacterized protein n=1 Tax=Dinoroseobacter shibae (strain DSM 16493 / NCIMB 14021 / DFL 12) TaxID=398580 RepID=A8LU04_DINSH|nr:hypothetical protein [Dinoroseobacter shibae]ABV95712.1 conserved hypothetical protein [Dinoroseobacter shibae DFL 12 = DSM 16493]URF49053.1 hypothetical protein M8008_20425 [Dinoroseobacter shibae]URF53362.1 hypothetical protein M8007_20450 [Dinoroseobacter shibae]